MSDSRAEMRWAQPVQVVYQGQADVQLRQYLTSHPHPAAAGALLGAMTRSTLNSVQDRIDELQSKIASIESRGKSPRSPPIRRSVPSQKHFSPNGYIDGPYVFSSNEYPAGPSRSLFASASNQPYVADYVPSECSSSSSNNLDFGFGNYAPNSMTDPSTCRNSPTIASWEPQPPAFEIGSPQILDSQATQMLGPDGTIPAPLAEKM